MALPEEDRHSPLLGTTPLRDLLIIVISIVCLVSIVFIMWIHYRRRIRLVHPAPNKYGGITEFDGEDLSDVSLHSLDGGPTVFPTIVGAPGPIFPENLITACRRESQSSTPIGNDEELASHVDLSPEALIATHKRQGLQRIRFIQDPHNVGLRHMALQQLGIQQKYERQIIRIRQLRR